MHKSKENQTVSDSSRDELTFVKSSRVSQSVADADADE